MDKLRPPLQALGLGLLVLAVDDEQSQVLIWLR